MIKEEILLFYLYIILYRFKDQNLVYIIKIIKKWFKKDLDKDIRLGIVHNERIGSMWIVQFLW